MLTSRDWRIIFQACKDYDAGWYDLADIIAARLAIKKARAKQDGTMVPWRHLR